MTTRKIKILDNDSLRVELDTLYEQTDQVTLAKWALSLAKHIMALTQLDEHNYPEIARAFAVNKQWQHGDARMHDVRQTGFTIHRLAKAQASELETTVFRVIGQAVGTGHMREHAMVASDYAIKVINLLYPNDLGHVTVERQYQIDTLKEIAKLS